MRALRFLFAFFLGTLQLFSSPLSEERVSVVATTAWTAAFARMAGVTDPSVLAPYELKHPPEYELRPSDIEAVINAEYVVFAGYENMVHKIKEAVEDDKPKLVQIRTDYRLATLKDSVLKIAAVAGDISVAEANLEKMARLYSDWKRVLKEEGHTALKVVVQFFHRPLAEELNFNIVGVFGPGPLEAAQITDLAQKKFDLIIDNWHNEAGTPLKEALPESKYVSFINFPGAYETMTLFDVLDYNRRVLADGLAETPVEEN